MPSNLNNNIKNNMPAITVNNKSFNPRLIILRSLFTIQETNDSMVNNRPPKTATNIIAYNNVHIETN